MRKYNLLFFIFLVIIHLVSCSKDDRSETRSGEEAIHKIRFKKVAYVTGGTVATVGQNTVTDLHGYLFKDSVLRKVYPDLTLNAEGICAIEVIRSKDTHLYFLANTTGLADTDFEVDAMTERDFLNVATIEGSGPSVSQSFMTGMLDISLITELEPEVLLTRGFARMDIHISADEQVSVEGVEIENLAKSSYLFAHMPVVSPDGATKGKFEMTYAPGISHTYEGVCYLYEQPGGQTVVLETRVQGVKNELKVQLPESIRRNHIYRIKISGTGASLEAKVDVAEWEDGEDTEATPDLSRLVKIDVANSVFPDGVRVSESRDTVYVPHYETAFKLALEADAEIEVRVSGTGAVVTPLPNVMASTDYVGNMFDVSTVLNAPDTPEHYIYLEIRNKNLPDYFGERLVMVIEKSTTVFSGIMASYFNNTTTCDIDRYVDGIIGTIDMIPGSTITSDQPWLKAEQTEEGGQTYRILAGYRPNDPEADGRIQSARLTIGHQNGLTETYLVKRPNYGLPVVLIDGVYWCKFNLRGNSRSFTDQVQISDPAALEPDLYAYLKGCTDEQYMQLIGDGYRGRNTTGLKLMYTGTGNSLFAYRNFASTSLQGGGINAADPTLQCPPGYQVPAFADFNKIFRNTRLDFTTAEEEMSVNYTTPGNLSASATRYKRDNIAYDSQVIPALYLNRIEVAGYPSLVLCGGGHQYNNTDMLFGYTIFASYNPSNIKQWDSGLAIFSTDTNDSKTRTIRCVKTSVNYIY